MLDLAIQKQLISIWNSMNKNYKNKESSYTQYFDANNLYGWSMTGKLPVDCFKWKKTILIDLTLILLRPMMKISIKDIF